MVTTRGALLLLASSFALAAAPCGAQARGAPQWTCTMAGSICSYDRYFSGTFTWENSHGNSSESGSYRYVGAITATIDSGRVTCEGSSNFTEHSIQSADSYVDTKREGRTSGEGALVLDLPEGNVAAGGEYRIRISCPAERVTETKTQNNAGTVYTETKVNESRPGSEHRLADFAEGTTRSWASIQGTQVHEPSEDDSDNIVMKWDLHSKPTTDAPDVTVSIDGPACACLEGEKVPGARVSWTARASRAGGTFGPFTVRAAGAAPRTVANTGGAAAARLTLEPTRASGGVTLTATYTLRGRATSETMEVAFCVQDSIRIGDGSRNVAFDDGTPGTLRIQTKSRALYDGADASAELAWTFEQIGAAATTVMEPESPTGGIVAVTYTGLPEFNAAFGPKRIEAALKKGDCDCKRATTFRAFYSPTATNHPPAGDDAYGESPTPNWFYYYAQTPAIGGVPDVRYAKARFSRRDNRPAIAQFDEDDGHIYVTDELWKTDCRPAVPRGRKPVATSGVGNRGIDCVAESVRHENQHRVEWAQWWPNGFLAPADLDLDGVPMSVELARPGCSVASGKSCDERPFTDVGDREINAYWVGWQWATGSLNSRDWACGPKGKQWKAGYGCVDD